MVLFLYILDFLNMPDITQILENFAATSKYFAFTR